MLALARSPVSSVSNASRSFLLVRHKLTRSGVIYHFESYVTIDGCSLLVNGPAHDLYETARDSTRLA